MIEMMARSWLPSGSQLWLVLGVAVAVAVLALAAFSLKLGAYWLQAYMSDADVSAASLIVMSLLGVEPRVIVTAKIMGRQAGVAIDRKQGMSTARLQAHYLAGGDVIKVVTAIIAAQRANIALDFDRATAIDLAGRDVLAAVRTSISPRVIYCPSLDHPGASLSAVAKNGVELRVGARVTVRTNLEQLIGGATEETIIARVGQGIVAAIGSAESHMDVLAMPSQISKATMARGLDSNTAFLIVSIDIADIDVGENIGARLQINQADADTRIARATAEVRRAEAIAYEQQMKAKVVESQAALILAEAEVPAALAEAIRAGRLRVKPPHTGQFARHRNPPPPTPETPPGNRPRRPSAEDAKTVIPFSRASEERDPHRPRPNAPPPTEQE